MSMFNPFGRMILFVDGLRFLASRTGLPFESLANQIGALDQPGQVAAKITHRSLSSAAFTTIIAESNFRYTPLMQLAEARAEITPDAAIRKLVPVSSGMGVE
jgi:protein-disulfide isomerase-like protein with CxxC motif